MIKGSTLLACNCEGNFQMIIGVPKEVKDHESRVGITPAGVKALVDAKHTVLVQTQAGDLSAELLYQLHRRFHRPAGRQQVKSITAVRKR